MSIVRGAPRSEALAPEGCASSPDWCRGPRFSWGPFLMPLLAWQELSQFWEDSSHTWLSDTKCLNSHCVQRPPGQSTPARPSPPPLLQGGGQTRDL